MRKRCFLLYFFLLGFVVSNGQTVMKYESMTPDIGGFVKSFNVSADLYNGLPNISIPIHVVTLKEFSLPIVLNYHAGGHKPDLYPGIVGLGWNLSAGGYIYRKINGENDQAPEKGTFSEYEKRTNMMAWNEKDNLLKYYEPVITNLDLKMQPDLDEFIVNIGPINASFYIYKTQDVGEIKGTIQTRISSKYNIDFKVKDIEVKKRDNVLTSIVNNHGYKIEYYDQFAYDIIQFTLVDNNGVEYIFGGDDLSYFDYSTHDIYTDNSNHVYTQHNISAWKIKSITNSIGENIKFFYTKGIVNITHQGYDYSIESANVFGQHLSYNSKITYEAGYSESRMKSSYLTQILTSRGEKIIFDLSSRNDAYFSLNNPGNGFKKIEKITINEDRYFKFNFRDNKNQKLSLMSIDCFGNDASYKYIFDYNPLSLPQYNSRQTDNWGYYNGKSYQELIKKDKHDELYNYRQSDTTKVKAEILEKITYPTGGWIKFEYESNRYSKIAKKYPFEIISENGITGGLRVKSIEMVDSINKIKNIKKEYFYINEDGTSSGILSHRPKYTARGNGTIDTYLGKTHIKGTFSYRYKSENYINWIVDNHIGYSRIEEKLSDGSRIVYKYSNFETNNDEEACGIYSPELSEDLYYYYTSNALSRGLLLEKEIYDNYNHMKQHIYNTYNYEPSDYLKTINRYAFANNIPIRITANKIYTYHPYLKTKKTVDYLNNSTVETIKTYKYNSQRLLVSEISQNRKGQIVENQYKYAEDFVKSSDPLNPDPYSILLSDNIRSKPIESIILINDKEIHRVKRNYKTKRVLLKSGSLALPLQGYIALPLSIEESFSGVTALNVIKSYQDFDDHQNPIEYIDKDGLKVFCFWNNEGKLIAEIKNATRENLLGALNGSWVSSDFDTRLANLRISEKLKNALITTYTYKPLVGMTSMTDARGVTTTYEYDSFGRLAKVKDANGKVINTYDYHYQN